MGDGIGRRLQFLVGLAPGQGQHGRPLPLTRVRQQGLEQLVEAQVRPGPQGPPGPGRQPFGLLGPELGQGLGRPRRGFPQPAQACQQGGKPEGSRVPGIQGGVHMPGQEQAAIGQQFVDQHHVLTRGMVVALVGELPLPQGRQGEAAVGPTRAGRVLGDGQVEQGIAQGVPQFRPLGPELPVDASKGIGPVGQGGRQHRLGVAQAAAEILTVQDQPQGQHVHPVAGNAPFLRRLAQGRGGAQQQFAAPAAPARLQPQGGEQQGMQAGLVLPGQGQ